MLQTHLMLTLRCNAIVTVALIIYFIFSVYGRAVCTSIVPPYLPYTLFVCFIKVAHSCRPFFHINELKTC